MEWVDIFPRFPWIVSFRIVQDLLSFSGVGVKKDVYLAITLRETNII